MTEQRAALDKWMDDNLRMKCYVLASMLKELQSQHEYMPTTHAMITYLQELYREQSHTACFELSKRLFNMKMHDEQSAHDHYMTMIKDLEELKKLRLNMQRELKVDLILQSLISSFGQFIVNYNINKLDCNLSKLVNMLITAEGILKSLRDYPREPKKRGEMPCEGC
uniref:Uncharacterized protein LOC105035001 n=1 Tax=Elaeis guineensis var. tenera TaxID=51953 RepID=A0A6I9QFM7_ELAGV|nr:uncharacterized protein LOC105035001 [Elaeis guineensis]